MARGEFGTLSGESLTEELDKLLARKRGSLASTNYPAYKGRTTVPMSSLTQRKRQLDEGFRNKQAPYSSKIESILNRTPQGFSGDQVQGLLDRLTTGNRGANRKVGTDRLRKQFGDNYANREARFNYKGEKDLNRMLPSDKRAFEDIGGQAKILNQGYNENLATGLQNMSADKNARRQGLSSILGELGNQKHAHGAMENNANRDSFNREVQDPYQKMNSLGAILSRHGGEVNENDESPSSMAIDSSNQKILEEGKRAFQTPTPYYPGQLVASLNPDITTSHSLAERLSPSYQDKFYDQRKDLRKDLVAREPVGTRSIDSLDERIAPQEENLDYETKQLIKSAQGRINADNVARGVYGSQAHIGEMEKAARNIIAQSHGNRSNVVQGGLTDNLKRFNMNDRADINRLGTLSEFGKNEFGGILDRIKGQNEHGANQWSNEQDKLNSDKNNFEDELNWQWPHMKSSFGGATGTGKSPHLNAVNTAGSVGGYNANTQGLNLNSLKNQATIAHSEVEKEPMVQGPKIDNQDKFQQEQERTKLAKERAYRQQQATDKMNRERAQQASELKNKQIMKDNFLAKWNKFMIRGDESDVYWNKPIGAMQASQGSHDTAFGRGIRYGGSITGANPNIMTLSEVRNQKNILANEASNYGLNPWKDLPGYK
jgi:hypothetical protein